MQINRSDTEVKGHRTKRELKPSLEIDTKAMIAATLEFLHPGGAVFELCALGPKTPKSPEWEGFTPAVKRRLWLVGLRTTTRW